MRSLALALAFRALWIAALVAAVAVVRGPAAGLLLLAAAAVALSAGLSRPTRRPVVSALPSCVEAHPARSPGLLGAEAARVAGAVAALVVSALLLAGGLLWRERVRTGVDAATAPAMTVAVPGPPATPRG